MTANPVVRLLKTPRWSPYVVGTMLGVLSWITFATMNKALGTSTTMVRATGAAERIVAPAHADNTPYFVKYIGTRAEPNAVVDWQFALVIFLAFGAFIAARLSGKVRAEHIPDLWQRRFGGSRALRYSAAFAGGIILIIGARMAGGCTSGHGLSGGMQLATSGWIFMGAMFAGGVPTALLLYSGLKDKGGAS
ncbi:MAG: YeeE/YedE family protein [Phycisphaerales bacterium]|nr:YeeE/YedE family protein [Phycisphaerales bacterium]